MTVVNTIQIDNNCDYEKFFEEYEIIDVIEDRVYKVVER